MLINGKPPLGPGDPVDPGADVVTLDGRPLRLAASLWLALHKPTGYVTSRAASERHPTVFTLIEDAPAALVAVGRLDVMSEGLLLFTTDGELAARLMHPRWEIPRAYQVQVTGPVGTEIRSRLDRGVLVEGETEPVRPVRWRFTPDAAGGTLELELAEGRSRIVRRLCAHFGLGVRRLVRTAYGPVSLGGLAPGAVRALDEAERRSLYGAVQLEPPDPNA